MQALKKYFENIMITSIANAQRMRLSDKLQATVCRARFNAPALASIRLYQLPTLTKMAEASNAATANHPTACWP